MGKLKFPMRFELTVENEKLLQHFRICALLSNVYKAKNNDYGDSFHKTYKEFGPVALAIRLQDKVSRLSALTASKDRMVKDETVRDTLMDIANYAILGIMELEEETNGVAEDTSTEIEQKEDS